MLFMLTIWDIAIALAIEQLKGGSVERIGGAEETLECLELREWNEAILARVRNAGQ